MTACGDVVQQKRVRQIDALLQTLPAITFGHLVP